MKKFLLLPLLLCLVIFCRAQIQPVPIEVNKWGGYIGCLDSEPGVPDHILAAGGLSGLYKSIDGGRTWRHVDELPAWRLGAVSFCPRDPNVILVTAGGDTRASRPGGIWRSTDKGRTWSNLSLPSIAGTPRCRENVSAYGVSWVPGTDSVLVATDCGVAISPNKGAAWSFVTVNPEGNPGNSLPDLVYNVLAVDGSNFVANTVSGTFWTSNAGRNWTLSRGIPTNSGGSSHSLCVSPTRRKILFYYNFSSMLQVSLDLGRTWNSFYGYGFGANQPPFVKATPATPGDENIFDLYVGDGVRLSRVRLDSRSTSGWSAVRPEYLALSHSDPQDILFHPVTKKPYILGGDGGIQLPQTEAATNWISVGGGRDGMNGLEIKGVGVQNPNGADEGQTDIYAATWHNNVVWSPNGGRTWSSLPDVAEAANLEVNGPYVNRSDARISMHAWNSWLRLYGTGYSPITTSFEPLYRQGAEGVYIRYLKKDGIECMFLNEGTNYHLAPVSGGPWVRFYQFTPGGDDRMLINSPSISYGPGGVVVMYQPYQTNTWGFNNELVRKLKHIEIRGTVSAPVTSVSTPAMRGFSTLGQMGEYWGKAVFSSSPDNPQFLIAADIGAGKMKKSTDGGESWADDDLLTALVTDYGRLQFYTVFPEVQPQAQVVSFNPHNDREIYISTVESGIIYSKDGGSSWNRIPGSEKVNHVNSIGYTPRGMVYFGSKARGVWKFNSRRFVRYPFSAIRDDRILIVDPMTGARVPIGDLGPDRCPPCRLYIVANGRVTDMQLTANGKPNISVSDMNMLMSYSQDTSSTEDVSFRQVVNLSSAVHPRITELEKSGRIVKGLITRDGKIAGLITADKSLVNFPPELLFRDEMLSKPERKSEPSKPHSEPGKAYAHYKPLITLNKQSAIQPVLKQGEKLSLTGRGFEPGKKGVNPVSIWIGTYLAASQIVPDAKGNFTIQLTLPPMAGRHTLEAAQQTKHGVIRQQVVIEILNKD
jgi:photosystem II stability/assembly factor-like uncharacterized protein